MTAPVECRYYGRDFTTAEMALLRALIAGPPALNRYALSKEFCRRIGCYKADGGIKDMMARVVMLAMHRDGRIELSTDGSHRKKKKAPNSMARCAGRPSRCRVGARSSEGGPESRPRRLEPRRLRAMLRA